jgi:mono/diheme cytochrome c family protein
MSAAATMKSRKWCRAHFAIACGVAFTWQALFANAAEPDSQSGDPARGKLLYYAHGCYECHGFNGETGARNLVGTGSPIVQDRDTFIAFLRLRANVTPMVPSAAMPSFPPTTLSDAQARDIFAYVRTFVLHSPDPRQIPALQKIIDSGTTPYKPAP